MGNLFLACNLQCNEISSNECNLVFKSDVEGIALTYANLYRRVLLQNTPYMSVAGIKCCVDGSYIRNFFEVVPGLTGSLIDISTLLHNSVFDIENDTDCTEVIIKTSLKGKVSLSDIVKDGNFTARNGEDISMRLISKDSTLASVVSGKVIELEIFFRKGVGFLQKDINTQALKRIVEDSEINDWIVTDSQHRGVVSVSYNVANTLGRETVTLGVKSYNNNIGEVVRSCTENIIRQLNKFSDELS